MNQNGAPDEEVLQWLATAGLFRGARDKTLKDAYSAATPVELKRGDTVFTGGHVAEKAYLIRTGRLKLIQVSEDGDEALLRYIGSGQLLAFAATFKNRTYPASAVVVQSGRAFSWTGATLRELMRSDAEVALNAVELVANRLYEFQERYIEVTTQPVDRRISLALLRLADKVGTRQDHEVLIGVPLTRQELAEMCGTTLYTASRVLSAWHKKGIIRASRERVYLRDTERLTRIAEGES